MPTYEYEHLEEPCSLGLVFEAVHAMKAPALEKCPSCGGPVRRLISRCNVNTPKTDSDLKSMGFTKLVRRDKGVYENVTAGDGESRYWDADRPETAPKIRGKIPD